MFFYIEQRLACPGLRALAWVVCILCIAVFAWPRTALAHASLISVRPADASVLLVAPPQAELVFNEAVAPLAFSLISPTGEKTELDHIRQDNNRLRVDLPPLKSPGTYAISWRVASTDGHPVGGSLVFSMGAASHTAIALPTLNRERAVAIWLARLVLYASLFFGVGGVLFCALAKRNSGDVRRILAATLLCGLAIAPVTIMLQGLDALDRPISAWVQAAVWRAAWSTSYAVAALLAMAALGLALISVLAANRPLRPFALLALFTLGLALAWSGHASTASPQWLARPTVWLHAVAIACWIGSLMPLLRWLRQPTPDVIDALRGFSRWIWLVLIALIGSGVTLVFLQFDRLSSLWLTAYGQVFMAKLALLALLFGLAAFNRYRLTGRVAGGDARTAKAMRRAIAAEIGLALCILAVAAVWRFTPPPRALAQAQAQAPSVAPLFFHMHASGAMAGVSITPPHANTPASLQIELSGRDFASARPKQVTVYFSNSAAGIEPIRREARGAADGTWHIDTLDLPLLGSWTMRIDALVSDFDRVSVEGTVSLGLLTGK